MLLTRAPSVCSDAHAAIIHSPRPYWDGSTRRLLRSRRSTRRGSTFLRRPVLPKTLMASEGDSGGEKPLEKSVQASTKECRALKRRTGGQRGCKRCIESISSHTWLKSNLR